LTPLLPLDATRSSSCRRLGYIVTESPAKIRFQPAVHQQPTVAANRARIRPNPCSRHAEPARRPGARRPHDSSATASSPVQPPVSPYNTTRRCNSPAGPGLGPHQHQVLGRPQIWPTSTSAKSGQSRHPLIVTSRFISITRRRFHHDNHSSVLTSARPATFLVHSRFQASLQDTRKIPRIDYLLQLLGCARLLDISLKTALKNHIPYTRVEISHTNLPLATSHNSPIQIFPYVHSPSRWHPTPFQETKATSRTRCSDRPSRDCAGLCF
jgi:hypothetical protein